MAIRNGGGTVRRRVLAAIVGVAALALVLFGLPLALSVADLYRSQQLSALQAEGSRAAALVADDLLRVGYRGITLPEQDLASGSRLGLYDAAGRRVAGQGPTTDRRSGKVAVTGRETDGSDGPELVAALPVAAVNGRYAIRVATDAQLVTERTTNTWLLMLALAAGVLGVAVVVARRRAQAIVAPLDQLAGRAEALGEGNFTLQVTESNLAEIDRVGTSLAVTGARLGRMLERERHFSADASHQLRTPMTRVRLTLESALLDPDDDPTAAIEKALDQMDGLEQTVTGLLALARGLPEGEQRTCRPDTAVEEAVARWTTDRRPVVALVPPSTPEARVSAVALTQALDVLIENALSHGLGVVQVSVREAGGGIAVDVVDQGPGLGPDPERLFVRGASASGSTGIGLALARALVEAEGGRLVAGRPVRGALLTLLLPAVERAVAHRRTPDEP